MTKESNEQKFQQFKSPINQPAPPQPNANQNMPQNNNQQLAQPIYIPNDGHE